eukprot:tig00020902_g15020.t1
MFCPVGPAAAKTAKTCLDASSRRRRQGCEQRPPPAGLSRLSILAAAAEDFGAKEWREELEELRREVGGGLSEQTRRTRSAVKGASGGRRSPRSPEEEAAEIERKLAEAEALRTRLETIRANLAEAAEDYQRASEATAGPAEGSNQGKGKKKKKKQKRRD